MPIIAVVSVSEDVKGFHVCLGSKQGQKPCSDFRRVCDGVDVGWRLPGQAAERSSCSARIQSCSPAIAISALHRPRAEARYIFLAPVSHNQSLQPRVPGEAQPCVLCAVPEGSSTTSLKGREASRYERWSHHDNRTNNPRNTPSRRARRQRMK